MTDIATRPVNIFLAMGDGPLKNVIQQTLPMFPENQHIFVDSPEKADLVIFTEIRDIESLYNKGQYFAHLNPTQQKVNLPEECMSIDALEFFPSIAKVLEDVRKNLSDEPDQPEGTDDATEEVPLLPDALSILVIDDTPKHIKSAKDLLAGHRLTTATGYQQAMSLLREEKFDVVLTDLHLPMSSQTLSNEVFKLGELVPYGILLMIEAARRGAELVAVVTDLNHHHDPFSAAFDHYSSFPVKIEGAKVQMMHARLVNDGAKDWKYALEQLQQS